MRITTTKIKKELSVNTPLGLIATLEKIAERGAVDPEKDHADADDALLKFIGDKRVTKAFNSITKYYA